MWAIELNFGFERNVSCETRVRSDVDVGETWQIK